MRCLDTLRGRSRGAKTTRASVSCGVSSCFIWLIISSFVLVSKSRRRLMHHGYNLLEHVGKATDKLSEILHGCRRRSRYLCQCRWWKGVLILCSRSISWRLCIWRSMAWFDDVLMADWWRHCVDLWRIGVLILRVCSSTKLFRCSARILWHLGCRVL